MTPDTLITYYLEMQQREDFRPKYVLDPSLEIREALIPLADFYRFLYRGVGYAWGWRDRLVWTDAEIENWLARPSTRLYVLYSSGTPAGYVELDQQPEGTEIAYFGLLAPFLGRGYGAHLLSFGIQCAWDLGAKRVWVHTCNLDSPHALRNYDKRGFKHYHQTEEPMPEKYKV